MEQGCVGNEPYMLDEALCDLALIEVEIGLGNAGQQRGYYGAVADPGRAPWAQDGEEIIQAADGTTEPPDDAGGQPVCARSR